MGEDARAQQVVRVLKEAAAAQERMAANAGSVVAVADAIANSLKQGGSVLVFGNGGSAADAQHFAAELLGRYEKDRKAWPAVALTTDTSALTAIGNDYGFDRVFARQIEALGRPGDVAVAISTSGASANVVAAAREAASRGLRTVALTGRDGGVLGSLVEVHINVPHDVTCRVQEVHMTLLHAICEIVERG